MSTALASVKGALNPLKAADVGDVLTRVLNEESTKEIAASYGVTRSALNQWLLANAETDWKTVQVIRAHKRKEDAEDDYDRIAQRIEGADKEERDRLTLALSLARERLKAAQWDLERICRRIYGQDVQADQLGRVTITLNIGAKSGEVATVEGECVVVNEANNVGDKTTK
jgi:transposase